MLEELANAVRGRAVSAEELVRLSLERIELLNTPLNAVIAIREEALDDARALDARIAAGDDPGALSGVPLLVKDMEDVAGMRSAYGSLMFADASPAKSDGLVPRRLRGAGAIVVGKTNQPEFAFAGFTDNLLFGATRNPWGTDWSPGGSSGGSGAALAAGMTAIATATDGGGSIRIPAAFCGLAGLKPTNGVIAREPIPDWIDLSTFGPMATSIADVRLLLDVEAGPAPGDPSALPDPRPRFDHLPRRVLAADRLVDWGPLPDGMRRSFEAALASVERDLDMPVKPVDPADVFHSGNPNDDWFTICAVEHVHHLGRDFCDANLDRFSARFRDVVEAARGMSVDDYLASRRRRFDYVRDLDELLGSDAVLVSPTLCYEGWRPDGVEPTTGRTPEGDGYNTDPQNVTGHPALSVPAGLSANGIPFGLQITGPRFRDDMVLAVGAAWEAANPWPASAPGYEPFAV